MSRKYSEDFHKLMREIVPGHRVDEIQKILMERGYTLTKSAVKSYKKNHNLVSGVKTGGTLGKSKVFPKEIFEYIYKNHQGVGADEMSRKILVKFGFNYKVSQIKSFYKNHRLRSGIDCRFKQGHVPANKGQKMECVHPNSQKTQFKKGHVPHNVVPIGSLIKKGDGYIWRKIGKAKWRQEHILIWEKANGKIPKGGMITFLDGNKENLSIENLELIDKRVNGVINKKNRRNSISEVTRAEIAVTKLEIITNDIKKGRK